MLVQSMQMINHQLCVGFQSEYLLVFESELTTDDHHLLDQLSQADLCANWSEPFWLDHRC